MKVIFLDIDGVLNCKTSKSKCQNYKGIDNDKVKKLKQIVEQTDSRLILCSSWKKEWEKIDKELQDYSANYLDKKLRKEKLYILDKTCDNGNNRGKGILSWLNKHPNVDKYIILDDELFDYETTGLLSYLVKTSYYEDGLNDGHVIQAIQMLNK